MDILSMRAVFVNIQNSSACHPIGSKKLQSLWYNISLLMSSLHYQVSDFKNRGVNYGFWIYSGTGGFPQRSQGIY